MGADRYEVQANGTEAYCLEPEKLVPIETKP